MIYPPSVLRVRVFHQGERNIRLWLPLFLLWPVALPLAILLWPLVYLGALLSARMNRMKMALALLPRLLLLSFHLRGLEVQVESSGK